MTLGRSQGGARPTAAVLEQTDPKGNLEAVAGRGFRDCVAGVSGLGGSFVSSGPGAKFSGSTHIFFPKINSGISWAGRSAARALQNL